MRRATTTRNWESPMVATVRMRRGERRKRRREEGGADEPGGQPQEVIDAGEADEPDGQDGRRGAEVALGEIDDLVQPVGEAEADGHERAEEPEDEALYPHAERDREERKLEDQDGGNRHQTCHRRSAAALANADVQRLTPFVTNVAPPGCPMVRLRVAVREHSGMSRVVRRRSAGSEWAIGRHPTLPFP
jgi:hypothetical protein